MFRPILAVLLAMAMTPPAQAQDVTVFAASSLKTALDTVATDWQQKTGHTVAVSYAASPALAKQIIQGAPADIYISASPEWMNTLASAGLIVAQSRVDLLSNHLVLVGQAGTAKVNIGPGLDLAVLLGGGKLAMAMVDSVPAGQYGKASLQSLGLWELVQPQVAQSENVRAALALVAAGEAPLGIVYASDAVAEPRVSVLGTFPDDSHPTILYPAALIAPATPLAADFLQYLRQDAARAVFQAQGFILPPKG